MKLRITETRQPRIIYYQGKPSITKDWGKGDGGVGERLHKNANMPQSLELNGDQYV